jgi:hypothetical protein
VSDRCSLLLGVGGAGLESQLHVQGRLITHDESAGIPDSTTQPNPTQPNPVSVELPRMRAAEALHFSAPVLLSNALAAFALNLAVFLLIGKTSALTMNIAGVIKDWMLIFFSFYLFKAPVTTLNLVGYIFCCS